MAQDNFDPKASSRQSPTTAVRSLRARIGAHALHAKHDSRKLTART